MPQPLENEPRDLLLDITNDLVIESDDFVFARGIDAVTQSCRIALQMFEEEWFLDLDVGIPYWQNILPDEKYYQMDLRSYKQLLPALPLQATEQGNAVRVGYGPLSLLVVSYWHMNSLNVKVMFKLN